MRSSPRCFIAAALACARTPALSAEWNRTTLVEDSRAGPAPPESDPLILRGKWRSGRDSNPTQA